MGCLLLARGRGKRQGPLSCSWAGVNSWLHGSLWQLLYSSLCILGDLSKGHTADWNLGLPGS